MMTQLEHDALICLHYQMHFPLELMAKYCVSEWELAQHFNASLTVQGVADYEAALAAMVAKGWLKVVREPRAVRLERLAAAGWLVPNADHFPEAGDLDFTRKGLALYRRTLREKHTTLEDTLECLDERGQTYSVVAATKTALDHRMRFLFADAPETRTINPLRIEDHLAQCLAQSPVRSVKIEPPTRVGRWLNREAYPHQSGWKITIHYRRKPRKRIVMSERCGKLPVAGSRTTPGADDA